MCSNTDVTDEWEGSGAINGKEARQYNHMPVSLKKKRLNVLLLCFPEKIPYAFTSIFASSSIRLHICTRDKNKISKILTNVWTNIESVIVGDAIWISYLFSSYTYKQLSSNTHRNVYNFLPSSASACKQLSETMEQVFLMIMMVDY